MDKKLLFEKKIIVTVGNIGSGKSTTVKGFAAQGYIVVCMDALRYMYGAGDYVFDRRIDFVSHKTAHTAVRLLMKKGVNIIVDEVGVSRWMRRPLIKLAKKNGYKICAYVMPRLTKDESIRRRMKNNHYKNVVDKDESRAIWEYVWEMFNKAYQPPSKEEGFDYIIKGMVKNNESCRIRRTVRRKNGTR